MGDDVLRWGLYVVCVPAGGDDIVRWGCMFYKQAIYTVLIDLYNDGGSGGMKVL